MVAVAHNSRWSFTRTKCFLAVLVVLGLLGATFGIVFALTSQSSQQQLPPEPTWCQWGGKINNPGYEWAVPRDKERNEWHAIVFYTRCRHRTYYLRPQVLQLGPRAGNSPQARCTRWHSACCVATLNVAKSLDNIAKSLEITNDHNRPCRATSSSCTAIL